MDRQTMNEPGASATVPSRGCDEYVRLDRRAFLGAGWARAATVLGGAAVASGALRRVAFAGGGAPQRDVLVYVFLRGGMDALTLCSPYGDGQYFAWRGALAVPAPGQSGGSIALDSFFGLAPSAAALHPAYTAGDLAFVHTCGSTDPTRSHFDAMKFLEGGTPNLGGVVSSTGWLARHLAAVPPSGSGQLRAMVLEDTMPLTLVGAPGTLPIPDPANFGFEGHGWTQASRRGVIESMFVAEGGALAPAATATMDSIDLLGGIDFTNYVPAGAAVYPDSEFGNAMKQAAAIIKAGIGVEVLEVDSHGWDDHDEMGPLNGALAARLGVVAQTLAALRTDLGSLLANVTVVVQSEFGRRVDVNGSAGTDHGRAGCMLVMGGHVNGGQVFRDWPGLTVPDLDDYALPVRIDYRDVLAEILERRLGNPNPVFPGHVRQTVNVVS